MSLGFHRMMLPYKPILQQESDGIRSLLLHPPSSGKPDEVRCDLVYNTVSQFSHDLIDQYFALSYVWGDLTDCRVIHIDNHPVEVTVNL